MPTERIQQLKFNFSLKYSDQQVARFWSRVDKNGPLPQTSPQLGNCWIWKGCVEGTGYGVWRPSQTHSKIGVHRTSFEIAHGEIPQGMVLHHRCYNILCVN